MESFQYNNKAVSVKFFSNQTKIPVVEIIKYFFLRGIEMQINSWLDEKYCRELCEEFGFKFIKAEQAHRENLYFEELLAKENSGKEWVKKYPVVAVMGHVNHGKTTLLDQIRKTNVAESEYSNITQHISSYQVKMKDNYITFLDTPGHEIFQKLRELGGVIADIIVLVISIEDGVQSQTKEVIQYFKKNNLKLIIFVNKIDRGEGGLGALKESLTQEGIELEEYGGDVVLVKGSARSGLGIPELLETIIVISELENYCTTLEPPAIGIILESRIEKGLGPVAEIITIRGTLNSGDYIAGEKIFCKLKTIQGERKEKLSKLIPATPATIAGFDQLPIPGTRFFSFANKNEAQEHYKSQTQNLQEGFDFKDDLSIAESNNPTHFSFIIKSKVLGSSEAIRSFLSKFKYSILSIGSGELNEADLKEASVKKAIIINFEQKIPKKLESQIEFLNIPIWSIRSVYELEERILDHKEKNRIIERVEKVVGRCKVIRLWTHSKIGTIAGCSVIFGSIKIENKVKLIREGNLLTKTSIKSFKTENFEIKEAKEGQECGIVLHNWNNIELDDVIESFEVTERKI
ncbi:translation initiation factor IF-2 [Mycoplasma ovis str. Michigan]|uniref:Translation initiation factor IF-2 n=1 Tax=Mycoplasma ovis str. Michigan TaxID=1415773 RepID=A0ABM5P0E0_9MOLU|nr:translation initiation factor IF-2 [Mycoplasma ovis]AHC39873.1 translation initiation factor IF-2 [Mycoplasma ovis str. Michigan]